jgi:hypothetical protein
MDNDMSTAILSCPYLCYNIYYAEGIFSANIHNVAIEPKKKVNRVKNGAIFINK